MSETSLHRFLIIEPHHDFPKIEERGEPFSLKEMQAAVGGDIEPINLISVSYDARRRANDLKDMLLSEGVYIFANEEGRRLKQEFNPLASKLIGVELVGPVLICSSELIE